jgi:hypothetical protein
MKVINLYRVLAAAHLTYAVDPIPSAFGQRGGIMLVAPPEQMKSTFVNCLSYYGNALVLSDLNVKMLVSRLREEIASGSKHTIAFSAFEKLYKRDMDTASNMEGCLSAMMEEGFNHASWEDTRSFVRTARCLVVGALVESTYRQKFPSWLDSGFARRFLWVHFKLKDPHLITRALVDWNPITVMNAGGLPTLPFAPIPFNTTKPERNRLRMLVANQPGQSTPYNLMIKILCVLKWYFRESKDPSKEAMECITDFAQSLDIRGGGALLEI